MRPFQARAGQPGAAEIRNEAVHKSMNQYILVHTFSNQSIPLHTARDVDEPPNPVRGSEVQ